MDTLLKASKLYPQNARIKKEMTDLVAKVHEMELAAIRTGDGFSDQDEDRAAVDDLGNVPTFPPATPINRIAGQPASATRSSLPFQRPAPNQETPMGELVFGGVILFAAFIMITVGRGLSAKGPGPASSILRALGYAAALVAILVIVGSGVVVIDAGSYRRCRWQSARWSFSLRYWCWWSWC